MKKILAAVLVVFMLLLMVACSSNIQAEDDTSKESEYAEASSETYNKPEEEKTEAVVKEFPLEFEKTVESLNESMESTGITLADPKTSPGESSDMGKHIAYTYSLGPGASLCIYASESTQHVLNFTVLTVASEIDSATLYNVCFLIGCLEGGLAGEEASRVDAELNMQDLSEDTFATSSTDSADFLYMVQDGSLVFMVTPA